MIQTLQLIKFFYPFILLAVFFCLYKKEYSIIKRFCWRMTITFSARKLFIIVVLSSLIFMNWCCYMTDPNRAVAFAAFMTCCLLFNRVADRGLHRQHERKRFWALTLMLALVCYSIPYMNSIFHVLYTLGVASVFYPSEKVLHMKDDTDRIDNPLDFLQKILKNYF